MQEPVIDARPSFVGSPYIHLSVSTLATGVWFKPVGLYGQCEIACVGSATVVVEATITGSATRVLATAATTTTYFYDWSTPHGMLRARVTSHYGGGAVQVAFVG